MYKQGDNTPESYLESCADNSARYDAMCEKENIKREEKKQKAKLTQMILRLNQASRFRF